MNDHDVRFGNLGLQWFTGNLFLPVFLLIVQAGHSQEPDFPQERRENRAQDALAERLKAEPEDLRILDQRWITMPHLGGRYELYKVLNTATGQSQRFALDASGTKIDYAQLVSRDQARRHQKYGAMQVTLHEMVEAGDRELIPVLVKLSVAEPEPIDKTQIQPDDLDSVAETARQRNARLEEAAMEIIKVLLDGQNVEEIVQFGPFFSATLPRDAIRKLSRDRRVAFIGMDKERAIEDYPNIAESLPTTGTHTVHSSGTQGAGVKIAILESGMPTRPQACFNIGAIQDDTLGINPHMTKSIGIIGNRYSSGACNGSWQGYAPQATVLLANVSDYKSQYKWAQDNGANVVTISWHFGSEETDGGLHSRDLFFDYFVTRYPWPTVFASAGNQASTGAYAAGKGHNFFGVADCLNDGDGNRYNDVIRSSSSWKNPTSPAGDREIPEIAAPGSRHELLGTSFGKTSCATPVAASVASLWMSRNRQLKIWPEAINAIMLATANMQQGDGSEWSPSSDGKDGTGLINAWYGSLTAGRRESTHAPQYRAHDYGRMRAGDFGDGFFKKQWRASTCTTRARIRVALTWNSKVDAETGPDLLDADLDLWVYDPDMNLVARSTSYDSSYEFVEFTPSRLGSHTIKIRGWQLPDDFISWYGVAWTVHYDIDDSR